MTASYPLPSDQQLAHLLDFTDESTHAERMRLVATTCRALYLHQDTERLAALLSQLVEHDEVMYRRLAVIGAHAARHLPTLAIAARDPSQLVSSNALRALTRVPGASSTLISLLENLPQRTYAFLVDNLLSSNDRAGSTSLLEHFADAKRDERIDDILLALLPLCEDDALFLHITSRFDFEELPLLRLAHRQPGPLLEMLEAQVPASSMLEAHAHHLCRQLIPSLTMLHAHFPTRTAHLVRRILPQKSFSHACVPLLVRIARSDASLFLDILSEKSGSVILPQLDRITPGSRFRTWSHDEQLAMLAAARLDIETVAQLLAHLPPSRRGGLFDQLWTREERASSLWSDNLLTVLPHRLRQREARRILTLSTVQASEHDRYHYAAYLPTEEATPILEELLGRSQAESREQAWRLLIKNLSLVRAPLTPLLQRASRKLANEQDPVRASFLSALSHLPGQRFQQAADGEALLTLLRHVIEARDTSWQTSLHASRVMQKLLVAHAHTPSHPLVKCAFQGLLMLSKHNAHATLPTLEAHVSEAVAQELTDTFIPWLEALSRRHYPLLLLQLTRALGKKAHGRARLQELLYDLIWTKGAPFSEAITLWLADPTTREARVLHLLERDPSTFAHERVSEHLHRRRQDLLTPYLQGAPLPRGLYQTPANVYHIPNFQDGFERWHTDQQRLFFEHLRVLISDEGQPMHARVSKIHTIARLPITRSQDMQTWLEHDATSICEAALGASIWLDSPRGVLTQLLSFLDTRHARVAMYALQRQLQCHTTADILATLDTILAPKHIKVTVHKEALRLLGDLGTPRAATRLLEEWRSKALHKDVILAMVHAARRMLHHEDARRLLDDITHGATSLSTDAARGILAMGLQGISPGFETRYIGALLGIVNAQNDPMVSVQFSSLVSSQSWRLEEDKHLQERIADTLSDELLDTSALRQSTWSMALYALLQLSPLDVFADMFIATSRTLVRRATTLPLASAPDHPRDNDALIRSHFVTTKLTRQGQIHAHDARMRQRYLAEVDRTMLLAGDTCALLAMHLFDLLLLDPKELEAHAALEQIGVVLEPWEETIALFSGFLEGFGTGHGEPMSAIKRSPPTRRTTLLQVFEAGFTSSWREQSKYFLFECFLIAARALDWPESWRATLFERRHDATSPPIQRRAMQVTF